MTKRVQDIIAKARRPSASPTLNAKEEEDSLW
jgi:hypothetical protein